MWCKFFVKIISVDQTLFLTSSVSTKAEEPEQIQEETITDTIEPLKIGKLLAHYNLH